MLEKVKEIIVAKLNVEADSLKPETRFKEDLEADSLDLFDLVMEFEDAFGVSIPSADLEQIKTIGSVVDYINSHKN